MANTTELFCFISRKHNCNPKALRVALADLYTIKNNIKHNDIAVCERLPSMVTKVIRTLVAYLKNQDFTRCKDDKRFKVAEIDDIPTVRAVDGGKVKRVLGQY